ncbi:MAG: penicillin-binding protein 2 [Chloroflexota bacterium]|nr:penicillin-binding protein 2 [Chloroflexota bacterium]
MIGRPLPSSARLLILRVATVLIFIVFAGQLWRIQFFQGEGLRARANENRFRLVEVRGARGVIYDRDGTLLVRNRPSFNIAIVPEELPEDDDPAIEEEMQRVVLERLERVIKQAVAGLPEPTPGPESAPVAETGDQPNQFGVTGPPRFRQTMSIDEALDSVRQGWQGGAYRPITFADQVDREIAFSVAEQSHLLPGVSLEIEPVRDYLNGTLTSHLLGYMGPVPQEYVASYEEEGYRANDQVGLAGLEFTYEKALRGKDGQRNIEVDVNGREVRTVGDIFPSASGNNLVLTLDVELQKLMEDALLQGLKEAKADTGVAIAMDPRNGEVLGLVSLPTYDNNLFAQGIELEDYQVLIEDKRRPLVNHAISGLYPPGSTFKIVAAGGALEEGVVTERTRLGDSFDGTVDGITWVSNRFFPDDPRFAQPFFCWIHEYKTGHYQVNIREALAVSCDTYFYQISGGFAKTFEGLGIDSLIDYTEAYGFGSPTGIDLPGENAGLVPSPRWKRLTYAETWSAGDTYNMSIGQGAMLSTPLQVLNATAAVANGGLLYRPQIVSRIEDTGGNVVEEFEPELIRELPIEPDYVNVIREGMWGAVNFPNGTAKDLVVPGVQVAGKTGTAEFWDPEIGFLRNNRLPTHGWFTAFAPYEDPEIAIVVFVYGGGEGSLTAMPVAEAILRGYFETQEAPLEPPAVEEIVEEPIEEVVPGIEETGQETE